MAAMTKAIRERIAACAVHGVTYWADHAERNTFWATTEDQQFVEVQIDRPRQTSYLAHKSGKKYTEATTLAGIATQLGYVEPEVDVLARPNATATISKLATALTTKTVTEVLDNLESVLQDRPREVVAAMIRHDPTWLEPFTMSELSDVLGHTDHDSEIQAELNHRKEAS